MFITRMSAMFMSRTVELWSESWPITEPTKAPATREQISSMAVRWVARVVFSTAVDSAILHFLFPTHRHGSRHKSRVGAVEGVLDARKKKKKEVKPLGEDPYRQADSDMSMVNSTVNKGQKALQERSSQDSRKQNKSTTYDGHTMQLVERRRIRSPVYRSPNDNNKNESDKRVTSLRVFPLTMCLVLQNKIGGRERGKQAIRWSLSLEKSSSLGDRQASLFTTWTDGEAVSLRYVARLLAAFGVVFDYGIVMVYSTFSYSSNIVQNVSALRR